MSKEIKVGEEIVLFDPTTPGERRKYLRFWLTAGQTTLDWLNEISDKPWKSPDRNVTSEQITAAEERTHKLQQTLESIS